MEHSNLNTYWNVKKGKKMFMLLKMVILVKRENLIKTIQSWIYRFLNFQRQDADSYYFDEDPWELPKDLHQEQVHIFCPKNISLLVTSETVC